MSQGDIKAPATQIAVGSIRISGAPAGTRAANLSQALQGGLERALGASALSHGARQSLDIPQLRLRLPAGASEAEITAALVRAIDAGARGKSS